MLLMPMMMSDMMEVDMLLLLRLLLLKMPKTIYALQKSSKFYGHAGHCAVILAGGVTSTDLTEMSA